jgi:hypothetical protein
VAQMRRCRTLGARPVLADALDPEAVAQAVAAAEPEVIVHQLTALSGKMRARDVRHPERSSMAKMTNRLRTEATDHLLAAGRAVGARRFVAQSIDACDGATRSASKRTTAPRFERTPADPGLQGGNAVHLSQYSLSQGSYAAARAEPSQLNRRAVTAPVEEPTDGAPLMSPTVPVGAMVTQKAAIHGAFSFRGAMGARVACRRCSYEPTGLAP